MSHSLSYYDHIPVTKKSTKDPKAKSKPPARPPTLNHGHGMKSGY